MKGLSINGHKLHEVTMLLEPYCYGSVSYLRYPKHIILHERTDDTLTLKIPAKLALELYRKGILPQEQESDIILSISGKKIGAYRIHDFRYPKDHSKIIKIVFKKTK